MLVLLLIKGGRCWSARGGTRPKGWEGSQLLKRNTRLLTGTSDRLITTEITSSAQSNVFNDTTRFYKERENQKHSKENIVPSEEISRALSKVRKRNQNHIDRHPHTRGSLRKHKQSRKQKSTRPRRRPVRKGRQVDPVKAGVDFSLAVFDPEVGKMCVTKEEEVASTERQRVLECTHKSVEKCHYTYVTQFKPSQEEVCEENFEKSCQITFKQQAYNETVRKCYRPTSKVCNGEGPEECRTVYESSCTTKYVEKQPGKFVGDTGCEKLPVEICGAGCTFEEGEEECHDKVLTSVVDLPEEVCDLNPQKTCKFITKLVPQLKPIHQCTIVPQEVCQMKFSSPQQIKKPLITKWCLDETPPQSGEESNSLNSSEQDRSSGNVEENAFIGPQLPLAEKLGSKDETSIPILELGLPARAEDDGIFKSQNREAMTDDNLVDRNESKEIEFDELPNSFFGNAIDFSASDVSSGQSQIEVEDFKTFLDESFPRQNFDQFVDFKDF